MPNKTNYEEFDGEMITRKLKTALDWAELKTWDDVRRLSSLRHLRNVGKKGEAEALAILAKRNK